MIQIEHCPQTRLLINSTFTLGCQIGHREFGA